MAVIELGKIVFINLIAYILLAINTGLSTEETFPYKGIIVSGELLVISIALVFPASLLFYQALSSEKGKKPDWPFFLSIILVAIIGGLFSQAKTDNDINLVLLPILTWGCVLTALSLTYYANLVKAVLDAVASGPPRKEKSEEI